MKRLGRLNCFDALHCDDPATNLGNLYAMHLPMWEDYALARFLVRSDLLSGVSRVISESRVSSERHVENAQTIRTQIIVALR